MPDNALTAFGSGVGLPSREEMAAYLNTAAAVLPAGSGGKQFLKISDKDGAWTFGADETVVEEDSLWAINPVSFFHGYIAWHNAAVEGEHRSSIRRPLPGIDSLPQVKAQNGWQLQQGFDLVCVSGEDAGVQCEFKTSSTGGKRAVGNVASAINDQFAKDPDALVPIVRLRDNKYYDKKYKKDQFPPVFEVVEWRRMDDVTPVEDKPEPVKEEPPARTRTRAAAAPVAKVEEPDEEAELAKEYEAAAATAEATPRRRQRR